jgi:hypothetical protein
MADTSWSESKRNLVERRRQEKAAKGRIADTLHAIGVLEGLSEPQQRQLVDHAYNVSYFLNWRAQVRDNEKRLDVLFTRGPVQLKGLRARAQQLRDAFESLQAHAAGISGSESVLMARFLDSDFQLSSVLAEIETAIQKLQIPADGDIQAMVPSKIDVKDPTNPYTTDLFKFFTVECGIGKSNASQRIAKIENALWHGNIQESDPGSSDTTPDRSSAILKRVKRHPPSTGRR